MTQRPSVSVCMATYNGASYVGHQLRTILDELREDDEVVVVDDASKDDTVDVIRSVADDRVRIVSHPRNTGYVRAFETALAAASGEILFLADQDDEWVPGRRDALAVPARDAGFAASNIVMLGSHDPLTSPLTHRPWLLSARTSRHRRRNELRILAGLAPYFGCAMALRSDQLEHVLPFPDFLTESHDLWIAIVANGLGRMRHVDAPTVRRRIHASNASASRPRVIGRVIGSRVMLLRALAEAARRRKAAR